MLMHLQHKRPDGELDTYHLKPGRKYFLGRGSACELRILDLKLSRKHCCIEFSDGAWHIEDLGSTNGCKVNGQQIVGTRNLIKDHRIEAGTTTMVVTGFANPDGTVEEPAVQQEVMPEGEQRDGDSSISGSDWEPEPSAESLVQTGALQPASSYKKSSPAPAVKAAVAKAASEGDGGITLAPNTMFASASALTPRQDEPVKPSGLPPAPPGLFDDAPAAAIAPVRAAPIKSLDLPVTAETRPAPRIKPVTIRVGRVDGGEMHTPTANNLLDDVAPTTFVPPVQAAPVAAAPVAAAPVAPAPAANPARSSSDGDERTFFITVLGRRIGPLSRSSARELKARELKGLLTLGDLDAYPKG